MTTNAEWIKIDPERVFQTLQQEAADKVNSAPGEVILDFSSVLRIDSHAQTIALARWNCCEVSRRSVYLMMTVQPALSGFRSRRRKMVKADNPK